MTRRYFVPDLPTQAASVDLPSPEAHHAIHVMRVAAGDEITLFDGKGHESQATIARVGRSECCCAVQPTAEVDREPTRSIHLGIALPKPDRAREMIERLTELGVKSVTPIVAERTQRPPSDSVIEKLRRGVIEACKQSGRNLLLQIRPTQTATEFFSQPPCQTRWIAHRSEVSVGIKSATESREITVAIGPEGGWSDEEVGCAAGHEFRSVDLGPRIYRIETAATVVAALLVSD